MGLRKVENFFGDRLVRNPTFSEYVCTGHLEGTARNDYESPQGPSALNPEKSICGLVLDVPGGS